MSNLNLEAMSQDEYRELLQSRLAFIRDEKPTHILTRDMDVEGWLVWRSLGVGSSDAAAVLGVSDYDNSTPVKRYFEKINVPKVKTESAYLRKKFRAGHLMEPVIATLFEEHPEIAPKDMKTYEDHKIRFHAAHPFILCNLDRRVSQKDHAPAFYEVKNMGWYAAKQLDESGITLDYWCQVQHQFLVTQYDRGYFGAFVEGWDLKLYEMQPDREYHDSMIAQYSDFWERVKLWIETGKIEPPDPINKSDVERLFERHADGKFLPATDEVYTLHARHQALTEQKKKLKEIDDEIKTIEERVALLCGDAQGLVNAEGRPLFEYKTVGGTDWTAIKNDMPWLFSKYKTDNAYRRVYRKKV